MSGCLSEVSVGLLKHCLLYFRCLEYFITYPECLLACHDFSLLAVCGVYAVTGAGQKLQVHFCLEINQRAGADILPLPFPAALIGRVGQVILLRCDLPARNID